MYLSLCEMLLQADYPGLIDTQPPTVKICRPATRNKFPKYCIIIIVIVIIIIIIIYCYFFIVTF